MDFLCRLFLPAPAAHPDWDRLVDLARQLEQNDGPSDSGGEPARLQKILDELVEIASNTHANDAQLRELERIKSQLNGTSVGAPDTLSRQRIRIASTLRHVFASVRQQENELNRGRFLHGARLGVFAAVLIAGALFLAFGDRLKFATLKLYWQPKGKNFSEWTMTPALVPIDGNWHPIELDIPDTPIIRLRIDPVEQGYLADSVDIRAATVYPIDGSTAQELPLTRWTCFNCSVKPTNGSYVLNALGDDPFVMGRFPNPIRLEKLSAEVRITPR